jgi:tRNA-dihydrouridine synthase 1
MLHARLFAQDSKYRQSHFQAVKPEDLRDGEADNVGAQQPWLDGNPSIDRPLFVQFCANDPQHLLEAAKKVAPYCDAVDLNLGCPQGIARKGHYGAFLQEDQDLIFRLINTLHRELDIPVTAKIRILETEAETLAYAQNVLRAGASILTVHGRRREQKGHLTGTADWKMLRFLRDNLPPETVLFANGNILQDGDVQKCLDATGADGVMSAEGNLSDPAIFGRPPPVGEEGREYWRGKDGKGGWRVDAVTRRYLDIIHKYALGNEPPARRPLFVPGDDTAQPEPREDNDEPPRKKQKQSDGTSGGGGGGSSSSSSSSKPKRIESPNISAMQPHLFHLLRHFVSRHTDIRDMLARARRHPGIDGYEQVLSAVEDRVSQGLREYERTGGKSWEDETRELMEKEDGVEGDSSVATLKRCKRPWWVVQPIVRPLPTEALAKGAIQPSKKEMKQKEKQAEGEEGKRKKQAADDVPEKMKADEGQLTETQKDIASRDELVSG